MTPQLIHQHPTDNCVFTVPLDSPNADYSLTDYLIPSLPITTEEGEDSIGYIATKSHEWGIEKVRVDENGRYLSFNCYESYPREHMAFPIDSRMTRADIEGAIEIFPNSTNTGWLFRHSESDEHHDRAYQLESIMTTLFQDAIDVKMQQVMASLVNPTQTRPIIGDSGSGGTQRANYIHWDALVRFRKECVKWCLEFEKLLHIGQHIQESDLHIHHQLLRAINQAKRIWTLDQSKKDSLDTISADVTAITAKINTIHTFETRWEKAARREAEAKKKAAAEAADNGDGGSND